MKFILTQYINEAMGMAEFEKLEDGSYYRRIPVCLGVIAFGATLKKCEEELRSVLEDWILVGLKLKHHLPAIHNLDLNMEPQNDSLVTV